METKNTKSEPACEHCKPAQPKFTDALKTYFPLILIFAYLTGFVALLAIQSGRWDTEAAMAAFMGAFFVAFSFFKFLDLKGFAAAYRTYDLVAKTVPGYGYAYPFIELGLGVAYLTGRAPFATNLTTLVVMTVSSLGVVQGLLQRREIQCACLGTVFNLPMTKITLFEDLLMAAMAAAMLPLSH